MRAVDSQPTRSIRNSPPRNPVIATPPASASHFSCSRSTPRDRRNRTVTAASERTNSKRIDIPQVGSTRNRDTPWGSAAGFSTVGYEPRGPSSTRRREREVEAHDHAEAEHVPPAPAERSAVREQLRDQARHDEHGHDDEPACEPPGPGRSGPALAAIERQVGVPVGQADRRQHRCRGEEQPTDRVGTLLSRDQEADAREQQRRDRCDQLDVQLRLPARGQVETVSHTDEPEREPERRDCHRDGEEQPGEAAAHVTSSRSQSETCVGCIVSSTAARSSAPSVSRSTCSRSRAPKLSSVRRASYLRR